MKGALLALALTAAAFVPSAGAQSVDEMMLAQDFVIAAITGDEAQMRALLSPSAVLSVSDGLRSVDGKLSKRAEPVDLTALRKLFPGCQLRNLIDSSKAILFEICIERPDRYRLVQFDVQGGKIKSVIVSRGWVNEPVVVQLPGQQ